jgi:hypothetical protein
MKKFLALSVLVITLLAGVNSFATGEFEPNDKVEIS